MMKPRTWQFAPVLASLLITVATLSAGVLSGTRWPSRDVPYAPAEGEIKDSVETAINLWNNTNGNPIKLREKTADDKAYVKFAVFNSVEECKPVGSPAGFAMVGYQGHVPHYVCLAANASPRTVMHELGHVMGLSHEHQHCRREDYLHVDVTGAQAWQLDQYTAYSCIPFFNGPKLSRMLWSYEYDFRSVMHYQLKPKWTIVDPKGKTRLQALGIQATEVGSKTELSEGDLKALHTLYGSP